MNVITFKFIRNYIKGNVSFKYVSISKSVNSGGESFHMSSNVDDSSSGKKLFVDDTSVVVIADKLTLCSGNDSTPSLNSFESTAGDFSCEELLVVV